jgi:hypothetical protein
VEEEVAAAGLQAALHEVGIHGAPQRWSAERERKGETFVAPPVWEGSGEIIFLGRARYRHTPFTVL